MIPPKVVSALLWGIDNAFSYNSGSMASCLNESKQTRNGSFFGKFHMKKTWLSKLECSSRSDGKDLGSQIPWSARTWDMHQTSWCIISSGTTASSKSQLQNELCLESPAPFLHSKTLSNDHEACIGCTMPDRIDNTLLNQRFLVQWWYHNSLNFGRYQTHMSKDLTFRISSRTTSM